MKQTNSSLCFICGKTTSAGKGINSYLEDTSSFIHYCDDCFNTEYKVTHVGPTFISSKLKETCSKCSIEDETGWIREKDSERLRYILYTQLHVRYVEKSKKILLETF